MYSLIVVVHTNRRVVLDLQDVTSPPQLFSQQHTAQILIILPSDSLRVDPLPIPEDSQPLDGDFLPDVEDYLIVAGVTVGVEMDREITTDEVVTETSQIQLKKEEYLLGYFGIGGT